MSYPSLEEKNFWSFFDSLPEKCGSLIHVNNATPFGRIFNLCSRIYADKKSNRAVAFFYVKVSTHTPINAFLDKCNSEKFSQDVYKLIQELADHYQGIGAVAEREGYLLIVPLPQNRIDSKLSDIGKQIHSVITGGFRHHDVAINVSVGASVYPQHSNNIEDLIRFSTISAYSCEINQLNLTVYEKGIDHLAKRQNAIISSISQLFHDAGSDDGISMHYQAKYSLTSGDIVGLEALSRWDHPTLGNIPPADFIPLVENTKLIRPFTKLIIKKTISDIALNMQEGFSLPVAVNISHKDLTDIGFIKFIKEMAAKHKVPHHLLEIEVTETSISTNTDLAILRITELHEAGFKVAIDDFGSGHSSFAYLAQLPIACIKIDSMFVQRIEDKRTGLIVQSIIELASNLGVGLIAEGVENEKELIILKSLNCPFGQGFLLAKPAPRVIAISNTTKW